MRNNRFIQCGLILMMLSLNQAQTETVLIDSGSSWKYLDDGSDQGTTWRQNNFDDSTWKSGQASLGFGNGTNTTINNHYPNSVDTDAATWYFRKKFTVESPNEFILIKFKIQRDGGAVVYLNGVELGRSNMSTGSVF